MIKHIDGDIFNSTCDIIAHQVNCRGVMGAGVAMQVKKRITGDQFDEYQRMCHNFKEKNLGNILAQYAAPRWYIHMFGQNDFGNAIQTDYAALQSCFKQLKQFAASSNLSIAIPYNIGCGLAGGDWKIVYDMIQVLFKFDAARLEIWKL